MVWILGGPRTGSSWLMNLITHPLVAVAAGSGSAPRPGQSGATAYAIPINEPYLGAHLAPIETLHPVGVFTPAEVREGDPSYFFSPQFEAVWRPRLRELIVARIGAQATAAAAEHGLINPLVICKEPNGSQAAPVIASTLPGCRLLFLVRDGRDVLDSLLDAVAPGSWLAGSLDTEAVATPAGRLDFLRRNAWLWLHRTTMIQRAVGAHAPALTHTVRYENLLADTPATLGAIAGWLGANPGESALAEAVQANAFAALPAEARGRGKASRFAEPGHWREGLSKDERELVNEILGPKLDELGYPT